MDEHYNDSCPTEPEQAPTVIYPQHPERKLCYEYVRNGDCKYRHDCRDHHPMRKICYEYVRNGDCKYRHDCRDHHPMDVYMSTGDRQYKQKCWYHHPIRQSAPTKKVKLEKCQIMEKVDVIFGSACSLLRRALEVPWFNRHATYGIKFKDTLQSQVPF